MSKSTVLTVIGFIAVATAAPVLPRWISASQYGS